MGETIEVIVGQVGKPHGLGGEVTVQVRTDEPELRFAAGARLRAESPTGGPATLQVSSTRWHSGRLLVRFEGAEDRDAAEALRGTVLHVDLPSEATPADPDEFYPHQLRGVRVVGTDGTQLGEVTDLVIGGAQDLLAVRAVDGRDVLVPFVRALVPEVDLTASRVVVADRPGLIAPEAQ